MKPEQRHKWSLGTLVLWTQIVLDYLSLNCMFVKYEKTNPQFCKGTLFLVQFSILTETDFQSQLGPYSDLQGPYLMWFPPLPPVSSWPCLLPLSSGYSVCQPHGFFIQYIRYIPTSRVLHLLLPYLEHYCLKCLPSKFFYILPAVTQSPLSSASFLVSLSLEPPIPSHFMSPFPDLVFFHACSNIWHILLLHPFYWMYNVSFKRQVFLPILLGRMELGTRSARPYLSNKSMW